MVIRYGMVPAVAGVVTGIAGAFAMTRFLSTLLFGVQPTDPLTFGGIAPAADGCRACGLLRAGAPRVDPMVALRAQ